MGFGRSLRPEIYITPVVLSGVLAVLIFAGLLSARKEEAFQGIASTFLGIFYVSWGLSHIYLIRDIRPEGRGLSFFLFIVVWALDVGAYAGGSRFGKNKLAPSVSPKKSWEGVAAGTACALAASVLVRAAFLPALSMSGALSLGFFVAVAAQISDLSESLFKRNVGVKDSGTLLPGHGGLLDRFDSFLLTAPAYYYALVFLGRG